MSLGESVQIAIGVVIGFGIAAFILVRMVRAAAVMINSAEGVEPDSERGE